MSVASFIAKTGTNPAFVALNAHCWFAFAVVRTLGAWALVPVLLLAAIKEFWFDATYEVPKQTFWDNATDFGGYALGAVLAVLAIFA